MIDYIKRSDAINAVYEEWDEWIYYDGSGREIASDTEDALCRLDAEDVAPVRHGRWIEYGENKDGTHNMRCSKCGAGLKSKGHANSYYTKHKYRYCPNCGAKMDEGGNDGTDD